MPNVLLVGGSNDLYDSLRNDPRWHVVRAVHGQVAATPVLGDPRSWHLVIDDCAHSEVEEAETAVTVSRDYLAEAQRARGIVLCAQVHDIWESRRPPGHHDFEVNATSDPASNHVVDFFDEFEHAFVNRSLTTTSLNVEAKALIENSYGRSLAVLEQDGLLPSRLLLIDLIDDESRLKAFEYLLYRTVPKLWPEVYSDLFRPRRVIELERLREAEIADRRGRVAEIDEAIDAELAFYAAFTPLTQLADDPLKDLVAKALSEVFECEVVDLDEEKGTDQPKTLDLLARKIGWCGFLEVRSSGTRAARIGIDLEPLDDHADRVAADHGPADSKILVFNGLYRREPDQRSEDALFSNQVAAEARDRGITLLSTQRLLEAIEARRNGEITVDDFIRALRTPGIFVPPWPRP